MVLEMMLALWCCVLGVLVDKGTLAYDPESSITGLYTGPYFDPLAKRNLSAHLGERATLPCTVRQLGDKSVSWVRMRDADILTVDRYTFVGDERFESHFSETRETWSLIIKYVQERDAGLYECQVSTEPKMSQLFSLRIVVPRVQIIPPGDKYMKAGSRVQIDCHIKNVVMLPDYIFWYHDDVRLMDNKDSNIIVTVKRTGPEAITSTLTMLDVPGEATGNYTCMPSNLHGDSVTLHVLNEKNPEAMQVESNSGTRLGGPNGYQLFVMFFLIMLKFDLFSLSIFTNKLHHISKAKTSQRQTKDEKKNSNLFTPLMSFNQINLLRFLVVYSSAFELDNTNNSASYSSCSSQSTPPGSISDLNFKSLSFKKQPYSLSPLAQNRYTNLKDTEGFRKSNDFTEIALNELVLCG